LWQCAAPSVKVKIGSKDFTEQRILGEIYALVLEHAGLGVDRRLGLGGTPIAQQGLLQGDIDLYPEYTGTGLLTILKESPKAFKGDTIAATQRNIFEAVRKGYEEKFNLVWLNPAPLNNTYTFVLKEETAEKFNLLTLSDLWARGSTLTFVGTPEFQVREDGLPGLESIYGKSPFKNYKAVDPGLRYEALRQGQADVVLGYATDGEIQDLNLKMLEDDRQFFPPYQVAPVVRRDLLERYPQVATVLNNLSPYLTNEVMQDLNDRVNAQKQEPAAVAKRFLIAKGLIPAQ
jgi:osmoprotectant transport system substrate-binding protein